MTVVSSEPIRVLLADDHPIVRRGIRDFLEEDSDLIVVAEAVDGCEAVRLAGEHRPNVTVLDLQMPGVPSTPWRAWLPACWPRSP